MPLTLDECVDDVRLRDALEELNPEPEVVDAIHQSTYFKDDIALWKIGLKFDTPIDVGAITAKVNNVEYIELEQGRPEGSVTVRPDGSVMFDIHAGPGVGSDE